MKRTLRYLVWMAVLLAVGLALKVRAGLTTFNSPISPLPTPTPFPVGTPFGTPAPLPATPTPTPTATPTPFPTPLPPWPTPTPLGEPPAPTQVAPLPTATPRAASPLTPACGNVRFSQENLAGGQVVVTATVINNSGGLWFEGRMLLRVFQFFEEAESDAGLCLPVPALGPGDSVTVAGRFPAPASAGRVMYRAWLYDLLHGRFLECQSGWFLANVRDPVPYRPVLQSPVDGTWVTTRTVQLRWQAQGAPTGAPSVQSYRVEMVDDRTGETLVSQALAGTVLDATVDRDRMVRWRVKARNSAGWGRWSDWWRFGIDTAPPTAPTVVTETHGVGQRVWTSMLPSFVWSGADDGGGSGVVGYYTVFSTSPSALPNWWTYEPGWSPTVSGTGSGKYYLRGYAQDALGQHRAPSTWYEYWLDVTPPTVPGAAVETHGAASDVWQRNVGDPAFTWGASSDTHSGLAGYEVYWGTDPAGSSGTFVSAPSFDPPAVGGSGTWYLRLRARDAVGNTTPWETRYIFRYDVTSPTLALSPQWEPSAWYSSSVVLRAEAADAHSGMSLLRLDGEDFAWSPAWRVISRTASGVYTATSLARDNVGNERAGSAVYRLDITPPTLEVTETRGLRGCQTTVPRPTLAFTLTDAHSGPAAVVVSWLSGKQTLGAVGSFTVPYFGTVSDTVRVVGADGVGLVNAREVPFCYVDPKDPGAGRPTAPTLNIEWPPGNRMGGGCHSSRPTVSLAGGGLVFDASYLERYEVETWFAGLSGGPVRLEQRYLTPAQAGSWKPHLPYPGYYEIRARAGALLSDGARVSSDFITTTFCFDDNPPPAPGQVRLCGLTSGQWTNRECLEGSWGAVSDWPAGLAHYSWCFGPGTCTPATTTVLTAATWTAGNIATDGEYRLRVTATDRVTNTSGASEFLYRLDRVAPTLSIVSPPAPLVSGTVSLSWRSADERSGLDYHVIRFGPYTYKTSGSATSWTGGGALAEGAYTVTLTAHDQAGNSTTLSPWLVRIDRTPPAISGGAVESNPASPRFTATVTASDAHAITTYEWRAGGVSGSTGTPFWSASLSAEGVYTVEVRATDEVGNWSAWQAIGRVVYDITPPSPSPPGPPPSPGGATNDPTFTLPNAPDVVYWTFALQPTGKTFTTTVPPTRYTLPLTDSGVYTVTVRACDESNCTSPGWVYVIVFDNVPPVVVVRGSDGWVATTRLEYTVAVTDDMDASPLLWYCLGECKPTEPLVGDVIVRNVDASGRYTVTVEAIDNAHNASIARGVAFVDITPPVVNNLTTNGGEWQRESRTARFAWTAYDRHSGIGGFEAVVGGPTPVTVTLPKDATSYTASQVPEDWEGVVRFRLRAWDRSTPWQFSGWAEAVFRYDGRPPIVAAYSSAGQSWQNTAPRATVRVRVTDGGSGVAEARYCIGDGGCVPNVPLPTDDIIVQGRSEVPVYLRVQARDAVGNTITETVYTLRYDADPPRLGLSLPGVTALPAITVTARVTDVAVADQVVVLFAARGDEVGRCTNLDACVLTFAGEGAYTVRLKATDNAGNRARVDAQVVYDASAPTVVLDAPARVSVAAGSFGVSWTARDAVGYRFLVDGSEKQSGSGPSGSAVVTIAPVTSTLHLRVEAWDTIGNKGFREATVEIVADYDMDGMADLWEARHGLNWKSAADANTDNDADGLTNLGEYQSGCCDPRDPDSDNDGLSDGGEVHTYGTGPCDPDTDDDGLTDGWEVEHGTDPLTPTSTDGQVAVEATPGEQTVGVGQTAHITVTVHNVGRNTIGGRLVATFPGGSSPDGDDAGWTVESGRAYRQVSLPAGGEEAYNLPLVYRAPGGNQITVSILEASTNVVVHVADSSWLVLEAVEHPVEVHPEGRVTVRIRLRNVSDVPAPGVSLRVRLGEEEKSYFRSLRPRELWVQATDFVVPGWSAFPDAARSSLSVRVEGAQGYAGGIAVVGPRFDIVGDVEPGSGVVTYTLKATNSGNRAGPLLAQLTWPAGAAPLKVLSGEAWIEPDGTLVWQRSNVNVAVGESCYAVVAVSVGAGSYRPAVRVDPAWALGRVAIPATWELRYLYLPLVMRNYGGR